jgi:hypothetical protein
MRLQEGTMTRKITDGAKAFIGSLFAAGVLAVAAIIILIISIIEPSRGKSAFNVAEFIPEKIEKNCYFERPLATITIEGLAEWLETSTRDTICIRKKTGEFWIIYPFEPVPKPPMEQGFY